MDVMHEIVFSDEKFLGVSALRDVMSCLDSTKYCVTGSFLSSILFTRSFSGTFDVLVRDETDALEVLHPQFKVDTRHGTIALDATNNAEAGSTLKVRLVDATSKNETMRQYLIENSDVRTCVIANKKGHVEKIDVYAPRRGPTLIAMVLERDDDPSTTVGIVEKIMWSLTNVGVAPLLRECRFVPKECVYAAADVIEDLFVAHANKTVTLLHANGTGESKTITSGELKKLGRPYAALLRA